MGWLANFLYPDNEKRQARVVQLYNDCEVVAFALPDQKGQIDKALARLSSVAEQAQRHVSGWTANLQAVSIGDRWRVDVPGAMAQLIAANKGSMNFLEIAATGLVGNVLVLNDFISMFGLPKGFPRNSSTLINVKELYEIAGLVGVGLTALDGAQVRSQLRDMIRSLLSSRSRLKYTQMKNAQLEKSMNEIADFCSLTAGGNDISALPAAAQAKFYDQVVKKYVENQEKALALVTEQRALVELSTLDLNRKAWRDEDG